MYELRKTLETISLETKYMSDSNSNPNSKIEIKLIGSDGDKWPILEKLWDFYSEKGIKTVFLSIGVGASPLADLEIAETLGCPLHIYEVRESVLKEWEEVQVILKSRKPSEQESAFTKGVESKWVLPKNIRIHKELPFFFSGTISLEDKSYPTKDVVSCVKECTSSMAMKEENMRVDLVKITLGNQYELSIIQSILTAGFQPGLFLIDWSDLPDENMASCIVAGHLQNCGYTLLANYGSRFLYAANGRCMYEICSWQVNNTENPMVREIVKSCKEAYGSESSEKISKD